MRYWSYAEQLYVENDATEHEVITLSEDEIIEQFYPYWEEKMIEKYGREEFERDWSPQDCVMDWVVINFAWESSDESSS